MKKIFSLKKCAIVTTLFIFMITSCEKETIVTNEPTQNIEEGFKSQTGNNDTVLDIENESESKPALHMSYSSDLTQEESKAKFDLEVKKFISNRKKLKGRGVSTEWFYKVYTYTGTQTHNNTDAAVRSKITFKTNKGSVIHTYTLDQPLLNDREKGSHDWYLMIRSYYPGQAVDWVEVTKGQLQLNGTDGWFVKRFHIYIYTQDQSVPATGFSRLYSYPDVWLDNNSNSGWDTYDTGSIGSGRVTF